MLRRHDEYDKRAGAEIKEVEEFAWKSAGLRNERAVDEWVDLLHGSTYQEAAHIMAALGMIAPLIESLFYQAFQGIRVTYYGADLIPPGHARTGMKAADHFWDRHLRYSHRTKSGYQRELVLASRNWRTRCL
jgi:hypothetical protein